MATRLQISQRVRLQIIQDRINQYGMRFPVAEISEKLDVDAGNLSNMLKGKKTISDNFLNAFNDKFPDKSEKSENENSATLQNNAVVTVQEYIDELRNDKRKLQNQVDSNLAGMLQLLAALSRHDRAFHETILRSLARLENRKESDLIIEARSSEAAKQLEETRMGTDESDM